eukprot:SAG31_NODE_705_length_12695_cov_3.147007_13_plen_174_part_00
MELGVGLKEWREPQLVDNLKDISDATTKEHAAQSLAEQLARLFFPDADAAAHISETGSSTFTRSVDLAHFRGAMLTLGGRTKLLYRGKHALPRAAAKRWTQARTVALASARLQVRTVRLHLFAKRCCHRRRSQSLKSCVRASQANTKPSENLEHVNVTVHDSNFHESFNGGEL